MPPWDALAARSVQPQCALVTEDNGEQDMTLDELQVG
jgi:hypothetical protein